MKKYIFLLKFALLTFFLGLLSVLVWVSLWKAAEKPFSSIGEPDKSLPVYTRTETKSENYEILESSFCELVKNPEAYNGKIIRLKGIFTNTHHGPLFDGECLQPEGTLTWVKATPEHWKEIQALTLKAYDNKTQLADLEMQAVGKFEKNTLSSPDENGLIMSSDAHEHQADYRFELIKIETAARSQGKYEFELPKPPPIKGRENHKSGKK